MGFGAEAAQAEEAGDPRAGGAARPRCSGLGDLLKRKPAQLSGGQRQRVAMGRAIVREPDAFLMDEPLSNLDAKLRVEMRAYVARCTSGSRTTTLYVTHDQTEAMTMGDRVVVMRDGRLEQCDVPQRLYEQPANMFVAGFIGSPAMNLVRSRLDAEATAHCTRRVRARRRCGCRRTCCARASALRELPRPLGDRSGSVPRTWRTQPSCRTRTARASTWTSSLAEPLGAELIAHFPLPGDSATADATGDLEQTAGATLTARLNPQSSARAGRRLRLAINVDRLHFFDEETEQQI